MNYLDLSFNQIKEIEKETFMFQFYLTNLILSNNEIEKIHDYMFENLSSLFQLKLDTNKIESIDDNAFKQVHAQTCSDLYQNMYLVLNIFKRYCSDQKCCIQNKKDNNCSFIKTCLCYNTALMRAV